MVRKERKDDEKGERREEKVGTLGKESYFSHRNKDKMMK